VVVGGNREGAGSRRGKSPALDVALRFLAQRPRSEREVRQRLARAGATEAEVERVLAQLRRHALVDDAAFARYWVDQRQAFRPRGSRRLRAELRQHGIASELAQRAAAEVEPNSDEDAYRLAAKRARVLLATSSPTADAHLRQRLASFLARRGYDWETISIVLDRVIAQYHDR
jgi:regulatory protein